MELASLFNVSAVQLQAFDHHLVQAGFGKEHIKCVLRNPKIAGEIVKIVSQWLPVFLPLEDQLKNFLSFNAWLSNEFPEYQISAKEILKLKKKIRSYSSLKAHPLLFFGFGDDGNGKADVVLSGSLAWLYLCSEGRPNSLTVVHSREIRLDRPKSFRLRPKAKPRPRGFYIKQLPSEDSQAIGMRYKGVSALKVWQQLKNKWGMASEGLQFLAVTHPQYIEKINGEDVPFICLPDYEVALNNDILSTAEDDEFSCCPCIFFKEEKRKLEMAPLRTDISDPSVGSGFLL